jgi:hypothetical protein
MNASHFRHFAREIRLLKGIMPERYRLDFALIIRDACQLSTNWPGWKEFQQQCEIDLEQVKEEKRVALASEKETT